MATFGAATFDEVITESLARYGVSTDPTIRLIAGGGEVFTAAGLSTTIAIDAICDLPTLNTLRAELAAGTVDTLVLDAETVPSVQLISIGPPLNVYDGEWWTVTLSFEQVETVVTPTIGVNLDGIGIQGVLGVSTSVGRNVRFATATVNVTHAQGTRGQWVEIFGGAGGDIVALFKGNLETISADYYPGQATLTCVGTLKRLQRQWDHLEVYTGQDDAAMITNLIEKRAGLHSIESSGWILGTKQEILLTPGQTFIEWVNRLDEVARYRTYDRHDGAVYRRRDDPVATGAPSLTLNEGEKILSISKSENYDAIRNRAFVSGIQLNGEGRDSDVAAISGDLDAMMPETAPNYNMYRLQSDLIETVEFAYGVATRIVTDLNRVQKSLEITVPFDPTIVVDDTVLVNAPSIGVAAACMIWDVKHQVDGSGGTTTITTNGGTL
jgi:hypothetical protein